jgi:hypothetical protein
MADGSQRRWHIACVRLAEVRFTLRVCAALAVLAASTPAGAEEPEPLQCVRYWPEARYSGAGYDHWVHLESACNVLASCNVVTNVNPDATVVTIQPGEHLAVLTWRGSPAYEFTTWVECLPAAFSGP